MDKNGVSVSNPSTEDMDSLKVYVANTTPIPVQSEGIDELVAYLKDSSSANDTPTSILTSSKNGPKMYPGIGLSGFTGLTTLIDIIPNGFILIHNDLMKLIGDGENSGGGLLSGIAKGGAAGLGAAAGGFIGGAAGGLVSGLFTGLSGGTSSHMKEITDQLDSELTADDFRDDPEVKAAQKEAFVSYLKTYYFEQTAALGGSAVGQAIGQGVVGVVEGVVGGLLDLVGLGQKDSLAAIAEKLDEQLTYESVASDANMMDQVIQVQHESVISYLKVYYAAQVSQMAGETAGNFVGGLLKGALNGVIEGVIGSVLDLFDANKEATTLATIADTLTQQIKIEDFVGDPDVLETQHEAVINYLKVYYAAQVSQMAGETAGNFVGGLLSGAITSLVEGILGPVFDLFNKDDQAQSLATIADTLTQAIDVNEYIDDDSVKEVQKNAILSYLRIYYSSQVSQLASDEVKNNIVNSLGNVISGAVEGVVGAVFSIFGKDKEDQSTSTFASKVQSLITTIDQNLSVSDLSQDADILKAQSDAVKAYVNIYYAGQIAQLTTDQAGGVLSKWASNIGEGINNFFTGLFGKKEEEGTDPLVEAVNDIIAIDSSKFQNIDEINTLKKDFLLATSRSILDATKAQIIKNFKSNLDKSEINNALEGFESSYLNALSENAQFDFSISQDSTNSIKMNTDTIVNQLYSAINLLTVISSNMNAGGDAVIINNQTVEDDFLEG